MKEDKSLINSDLVFLDVEAENQWEVLHKLAMELEMQGYVKSSYGEAVIEREKVFPTGLPTMNVQVAIPHTDAKHVNNAGILFANLNKPILFKEMGNGVNDVSAEMIFMLAIDKPENQVETLGKLMSIFSDGEFLKKLKSLTDSEKVVELLSSKIS
ncbi:MAG: PTS sugar transporter subunit IIA [Tissierellales bacterium]|nr:PTS sugar transporter subunit IIA [Tissierellales bacterium]